MVNFEITKALKRKARRRRIRKEKKWVALRIVAAASGIAVLFSVIAGLAIIVKHKLMLLDKVAVSLSVSLIIYIVAKTVLKNLTSHWIQDRLNEKLWIENGILYHFVQTAFAAGWNFRHADASARIYEYDLSTLSDARFDPRSGRIECKMNGRLVFYRNYYKGLMEYERPINGKPVVFYEYMKPSLYTYLQAQGVEFIAESIDFSIRDYHV